MDKKRQDLPYLRLIVSTTTPTSKKQQNLLNLPDAKLTIRTLAGVLARICYESMDLRRKNDSTREILVIKKIGSYFTVKASRSIPIHIMAVGQTREIDDLKFSVEEIVR